MKTAYIVKAYRTAVGKANKGGFRFSRPDDLAADVIKYMLNEVPELDHDLIDDVIVGLITKGQRNFLEIKSSSGEVGSQVSEIPVKIKGAKKDFEPFIRYNEFGDSNINFSVILRVEEPIAK